MFNGLFIERTAIFSSDHKYRYQLSRRWGNGDSLYFVMLNPSTANENVNDPTIRRCTGFAKTWNYDGIEVLNLFALVSSDPDKLLTESNSVGIDNDKYLITTSKQAKKIIVAWGNFGLRFSQRVSEVLNIYKERDIYCLGETGQNQPRHPLYVPKYQTLNIYSQR